MSMISLTEESDSNILLLSGLEEFSAGVSPLPEEHGIESDEGLAGAANPVLFRLPIIKPTAGKKIGRKSEKEVTHKKRMPKLMLMKRQMISVIRRIGSWKVNINLEKGNAGN
uniref:Uncharacterized protein n=1 Tax=Opuntia streptacantha TaxID=393608 RepID=A0A7C9F171_OPUST